MQRSKLEACIDVLKLLAQQDPLSLDEIMHNLTIEFGLLRDCVDTLCKQRLIEEYKERNKIGNYLLTPRGIRVLRFFEIAHENADKKLEP